MLKTAKDIQSGGVERHGKFIAITADPHLHFYHIKRHPASPIGHAWTTRPSLKAARFIASVWRQYERMVVKYSKSPEMALGSGHTIDKAM